ncbi:MAG: beta propeller repeat protein, partial [Ktedonobacteraceae bacterium]
NVWAVGWTGTSTLIEHWDGSQWHLVSSPALDGAFLGISAQSATDIWAVGDQLKGGPLTEHWDGSSWQVVPAPGVLDKSTQFNAVSVLSPTDVWAVGSYVSHGGHALPYTLIEHWDGIAWHIVSSPNVGGFSPLNGVAALSSQNVWAVGRLGDSTLNEHWDGQRWRVVSPALNGTTYSVVALTPSNVWAVGFALVNYVFDTFVEQWNGTQWQQVRSPNMTATTLSPSYENYLNGVSASSAQDIWAVGYVEANLGDTTYTLIEHYC